MSTTESSAPARTLHEDEMERHGDRHSADDPAS